MVTKISPALIIFLFSLYAAAACAQTKVESPAGVTNLYERALSACVTEQLERFGNQGPETRLRLLHRVVERADLLTNKLPAQFGEIKVEYLDWQAIITRYKKNRADIFVTKIRPIQNEGAILRISLSDHYASYKKRVFSYALEGGCTVDFKFDGRLDNFAVTNIDLWGV